MAVPAAQVPARHGARLPPAYWEVLMGEPALALAAVLEQELEMAREPVPAQPPVPA